MSKRDEVLYTFVEMITTAIPDTIAIYEFNKEIAQFNKILQGKKGIVLILEPSDYSVENMMIIDLIYDKIQDIYGWPEGTAFANSFSRSYIRTPTNLWHINMLNNHCLLPEDQINLLKTRKLIYGKDIIKFTEFPHNEQEILRINPGLSRSEALKIKERHQEYLPLVDPNVCWTRLEFAVENKVSHFIENGLKILPSNKPLHHFHIYGRYGGSGKTQLIYAAIKKCKQLQLPFIYRTEFWKGSDGKYMDIDYNPDNAPDAVAKWVAENIPALTFVLFLDEVDIDLEVLKSELEKKGHDTRYLIVSAAKEIPDFVNSSFDVYDITVQYPFSHDELSSIIKHLCSESNLNSIFTDEIINIIVSKNQLWNHTVTRKTPQSVILSTSLCLIEALKISDTTNSELKITTELIDKWSMLSTSPWWQQYSEVHDVHAEFLIFDGKEYIDIDPHYHFPLP